MAKLSAHGEEVHRFKLDGVEYSQRTDGALLKRMKICGTFEGWKLITRKTPDRTIARLIVAEQEYRERVTHERP